MTGRHSGTSTAPDRCGQGSGTPGRRRSGRLHRRLGRGDLPAVKDVRHGLRELLRRCGRQSSADVAELLTSELVTNALVHTDRGAVVTAGVGPAGLRVEVRDFTNGQPEPRGATDESTHGRGLLLVQALADAWGVRTHEVGKSVWFELEGGQA
ncbi:MULTISPECIES: ATP-binding protein [unclassified Streptomyces]|uniref:ATP-binding protein n=1 Tax=unclassified Streptomyces TaxID=2593676 RepID=UPI002E1C4E79|nr:ATP-binding protein [Streptomyces sp. NBC_01023]